MNNHKLIKNKSIIFIVKNSNLVWSLSLKFLKIYNFILSLIFSSYIKKQILTKQLSFSKNREYSNKILFIIPNLGSGGAERQLVNLANSLSRNYKDNSLELPLITIVCFNSTSTSNQFYLSQIDPSINIVNLNDEIYFNDRVEALRKNFKYFFLGKDLIYFHKLRLLIEKENPKIVHAWLDLPSVFSGVAALSSGIPRIILSTRSMNPTFFLSNRFYLRTFYKSLSNFHQIKILNNSDAGARSYEKWIGLRHDAIKVIRNGFNIGDFLKLYSTTDKSSNSTKIVGGVMRFSNEKNITLWLKVAKLITQVDNKVNFQIIGDGPQRNKIQKMINKYHLSSVVTMHSPTKDVYSKMINFDVFLQTSLIEGLPNSLIEAQLLGIPVVSTNAGGSAEAFIHNQTGFICPPGDTKSLSESVLILLRDRELNSEFSANAMKYSISKFDIENITLEYMNLYNTVFLKHDF